MLKPIQILPILLLGCASTRAAAQPALNYCFTPCGMYSVDVADCAGLNKLEAATLHALQRRMHWPYAKSCSALRGWQLKFEEGEPALCPSGGWYAVHMGGAGCVVGLTDPTSHVIHMYSVDWRDRYVRRVYAHEVVHALTLEDPASPLYGHCQWEHAGAKAAINDVSGVWDPTPSICSCEP